MLHLKKKMTDIYGFTFRSRIFHLHRDVTIASERLQNLGLCSAVRPNQGLWAGRDLYRATPTVTWYLGFFGLIRRTSPFSHLARTTHMGMRRIYCYTYPHAFKCSVSAVTLDVLFSNEQRGSTWSPIWIIIAFCLFTVLRPAQYNRREGSLSWPRFSGPPHSVASSDTQGDVEDLF
jgi:hypothetical protein